MIVGELVDSGDAEIRTGPFGTQLRASDYVADGRPVLNVRNVGFGDVRTDKLEYIDERTAKRLSGHLLQAGDIVFGRKGAVERHAFIREEFVGAMQGSDCIRLRIGSDAPIRAEFASFALRTQEHQAWMQSFCSHGATMASLNQDILRQVHLPDLPLPAQDGVVRVLGAIEALIENNRRRVEILEAMTRAIYTEWFVHFRYPGHEDASIVDSSLGRIPEDWVVVRVGDVVELRYGKALKKDDRRGGQVAVLGSSGVVGWHDDALVTGPSVIVGRKGNVGSITWVDGTSWPIDTTYYVVTELPLRYVVEQLRRTEFLNTHAAVPGLSRDQAYSRPFLLPSTTVMDQFSEISEDLASEASALAAQSRRLASLRDLLLPKLVTGKIDVWSLDLDASVT